jgi:hypothetical protein
MKEQKKNKKQPVEKMLGMEFTIDESLEKYKGPEYRPEKLDKIEQKFSKPIIIHQ